MRDTKQDDGRTPKATDAAETVKPADLAKPVEQNAFRDADRNSRDTNAVFHVLDALEPPVANQRVLRGGVMLLAGVFLLAAVGLLLSRYSEGMRQQSQAVTLRGLTPDTTARNPALPELENGWGERPAASTEADPKTMQASRRSSTAVLPSETSPPAAGPMLADAAMAHPAQHSPSRDAATGTTLRNKVTHASRKSVMNAAETRAASRPRERHSHARQLRQLENPARASGKLANSGKSGRKDADVDLIAALLARTPQKANSEKGNEQALQARAQAGARSPGLHAGLGGRAASTDVVIRAQADTTDSLVKRCGTLGVIEAHLCRARICSGLWGRDAACPAGEPANIH